MMSAKQQCTTAIGIFTVLFNDREPPVNRTTRIRNSVRELSEFVSPQSGRTRKIHEHQTAVARLSNFEFSVNHRRSGRTDFIVERNDRELHAATTRTTDKMEEMSTYAIVTQTIGVAQDLLDRGYELWMGPLVSGADTIRMCQNCGDFHRWLIHPSGQHSCN